MFYSSIKNPYWILLSVFFLFGVRSNAQYCYNNDESAAWADSVLLRLSDDEKIGQLFMIYAETTWDGANLSYYKKQMAEKCPGGLILFKGGPSKAKQFVNESQRLAKVPLLIGVDGEYGLSMRMDSFELIPYNMVLGAIRDNRIIVEVGNVIGRQCKEIGVHVNFSPVLDLNNNPANPVINYRSFGENAVNTIDKGYAMLLGMEQMGVMGVGKHFPGHGNTGVDSHYKLPVINGDYAQLDSMELLPFKQLSHRGLKAIMVGHLNVPGLDSTGLPATLSHKVVTQILKDSIGFNGLIITDGMNMASVTSGFDQPFVKAIKAGNDILLLPAVYSKAFDEVKSAVANRSLSMDEVESSCKRILQAKYFALQAAKIPDTIPNNSSVHALTHTIYKNAVTLLKNENSTIPFIPIGNKKVAIIENGSIGKFQETVRFYENVDVFNFSDFENTSNIVAKLKNYDRVIFGLHGSITAAKVNYNLKKEWFTCADSLADYTDVSLVLMANPYALQNISKEGYRKLTSVVIGYSDSEIAQSYCAQLLYGGIPALGKLSVSVFPYAKEGEGIYTHQLQIGMDAPLNCGMKESLESDVDRLVTKALKDGAMPGCQVLVAKDGKIVLNKSYGYHTYAKKIPVKNTDLYDLASVTKVSATLPVLMKMDENGIFCLDKTLGEYLPRLEKTNKKDIVMRDVLRHTAGLESHIAYQLALVDPKSVEQLGLFSSRYSSTFNIKIDQHAYLSRYMKFYPGMLSAVSTPDFPTKVAESLYINKCFSDTIIARLDSSEISVGNKYKYSDLGFFYLKEIIESKMNKPLDKLASEWFFKPLGMTYTVYNPLEHFELNNIVPTENDKYFRKQLLCGYVHDEGAALMGGVGAHAGLFSNAGDLSKLFQMYLNLGSYAGTSTLQWNTIQYYTSSTEGDGRRAIGFDKPELDPNEIGPTCKLVSAESYGHTGFTGTYVWADPKYNLIYVFLSNRIHPDVWNRKLISDNVRTKIQEAIYKCIDE